MEAWRRVEVAACEEMDGPTASDLEAIRAATFTVDAVQRREEITDHDVAAFVDVLSASAGPAGRWIHFGLTSSDVLDTALGLQLQAAGDIVVAGARELAWALAERAREHVDTVCVGRTHGVHAEPTTFGIKLAGFAMEAHRNALRLQLAFGQAAVGALSGAVGTYASHPPAFEAAVLARLGLAAETVSTQVVPRDRHAEVLQAISLAGAGLERLATEIRHLQRTEVLEATEPFRSGAQKGSSAMPHKRNPITSERITGLARVLRGNAQAAVENVALWHERDISHSGAERVILPDSTILLDYLHHRALRLVRGLVVDAARMRRNLDLTHGALFSQRVLLALVASGMERDEAYRIVQEEAQRAWDEGIALRDLLERRDLGLDLDDRLRPRRVHPARARDRRAAGRHSRPSEGSATVASLRRVTALADLQLLSSGKVRELYDLGDELLMVASDRISTYDVVHPTPIPDKGKVLTGLSVFWFGATQHIVANHLVSATDGVPAEARGRGLAVRKLKMLPVECVVRGYITGSGWKDYRATGSVSGIALPAGLQESQELPEPLFTPSTKAEVGHDEAIDFEGAVALDRGPRADRAGPRRVARPLRLRRATTRASAASSWPTRSSSSASTTPACSRSATRC